MKTTTQKLLFSAASGIFGILAFPPFGYNVFAWFALVPLFFAIKDLAPQKAFGYSYFSGIVFFGGLLYWLSNVTIPGMIILVLVLALFYGIFGMIAAYAIKRSMDLLVLPFVWVALEYVRGNLFTGFPWGLLGVSQYTNLNIIQIADMTGAYGVSFLLAAFNVALFALLRRPKKMSYMMVALVFILMATTYGRYRLAAERTWTEGRLSVIQGNIPQSFKWDAGRAGWIVDTYTDLTREASHDKADMIIWPETAYPYLEDGVTPVADDISGLAGEVGIPILSGVIFSEGDVYFNGAVLFNGKGEPAGRYYKIHLVPFGEYIPFSRYMDFLRGFIDKPIGDFGRGDEYKLFPVKTTSTYSGVDGAISRKTSFLKFGVLICFEDVFPYVARDFVLKGADFLINITNDAWFGETAAAEQHLSSSVFRAVENRVPVVRAANTGISCFITASGRISSRLEEGGRDIFVKGFDTDTINIAPGTSFYTTYGDAFVYFCIFMIALLFFTEWLMRRKKP